MCRSRCTERWNSKHLEKLLIGNVHRKKLFCSFSKFLKIKTCANRCNRFGQDFKRYSALPLCICVFSSQQYRPQTSTFFESSTAQQLLSTGFTWRLMVVLRTFAVILFEAKASPLDKHISYSSLLLVAALCFMGVVQ